MTDDRPWMTAIEMQYAALRRLRHGRDQYDGDNEASITLQEQFLRRAPTFAWAAETTKAVYLASRTIPLDTPLTIEGEDERYGWWWFDEPLAMIDTVKRGVREMRALVWGRNAGSNEPRTVVIMGFVLDEHNVPRMGHGFGWKLGQTLGDAIADFERQRPDLGPSEAGLRTLLPLLGRFFLAGHAWLQQRICVTSIGPIERHRRKQLARESNAPLPSDVKVVELRRLESRSGPASPDAESVDWSCRWVVSGHWRNQYHPSDGRHALRFVHPYVKGPADKPLRVPQKTVFNVRR